MDASAQYTGQTTVLVGQTATYQCIGCFQYDPTLTATEQTASMQSEQTTEQLMAPLPSWTVHTTYGTIQNQSYDLSTHTATVTVYWHTAGTGWIQCNSSTGSWPKMNITVSTCPTIGLPGYTVTPQEIYYNETATINAQPGTNGTVVRWYTTATAAHGTHFHEGTSYTTPNLTSNAVYYIRSFTTQGSYNCYSSVRQISLNVNACPRLGMPIISSAPLAVCSGSPVSIPVTPGSNGTSVRWYNTPGGTANYIFEGNSYTTTPPGSRNYFVRSYTVFNGNSCYSDAAVIPVTVNPLPKAPIAEAPFAFYSGKVALRGDFWKDTVQFTVNGTTLRWYQQSSGGAMLAEGKEYIASPASGLSTYYVATYNEGTGCEGPRTEVAVSRHKEIVNIKSHAVRVEGIQAPAHVVNLPESQRNTSVTYLDGFLRAVQQIGVNAAPGENDIYAFAEYDALGRPTVTYLPYATNSTTNAFDPNYKTNQATFYNTGTDKVADDTAPFAKTVYEPSPLGRVLEQGSIGAAWQPGTGHTRQVTYSYNEANEVRHFAADGTSTGFYAPNTLSKLLLKDEDGAHIITYTDSRGRTILKRQQLDDTIGGATVSHLETYYIYDDLDRVKYIISPKGVHAVKAANWAISPSIYNQFVYQFVYDAKGRIIEKKVPGQAWSYFGYDRLNRLVLMQDGHLKAQNKWMYVKYDRRGRAVVTGLYTNTTQLTRAAIQQELLDPLYADPAAPYFEARGTAAHGYTNQSFPVTNTEVLNVNYYDNYDFDYNQSPDFAYTPQGLAGEGSATTLTQGLATGGKRLILETGTWLYNYVFYDKYGRAIQVRSNNHLSAAVDNLGTVVYDFEGKALITKNYHNAGANKQATVINKYGYDAKGRLTKIFQNNNGAPSDQLVVQYEYNELGQVVDKKLHDQGGASFLQSVDYRYTIRGWLASINNANLAPDATNNDETNDLFGMEFLYNTVDTQLGNTGYFNGNISATKWKGVGAAAGAGDRQSYTYAYDKSGKLKTASSKVSDAAGWNKELNANNEAMTYDHNGNILTLARNQRTHQLSGTAASYTSSAMDNLAYTYDTSIGDRLAKVEDASGNPEGFKDTNATTDYSYDDNGNLTRDDNKGISNIAYNFLGKVARIDYTDGRKTEYVYDASGAKLTVKNFQGTTLQHTTDYVGGFVYENNELKFFGSPEGRVVKTGTTLEYQYAITDHQGNTRVVLTSATPAPAELVATFEGDTGDGTSQYQNVVAANVVTFFAANNTPGGSKVVRMNQGYKIGPSKSVHVYPGDKVDMEVWEYHEGSGGFGSSGTGATALINMVAAAFGGVSGGAGESGAIYDGVSDAITGFGAGGNQGDTRPAAYLNYILFDKNYNVLDAGWQLAPGATFTKQRLSFPTLEVREEGFVFVYLSYDNDSPNWVYFDDLKVKHTKTNVIQYNEYYPFGLQTDASWTREDHSNKFLYNAGSELNAASGWYETFYRGYDPALGRFMQVDPMAASYASFTPYNYAVNSPVLLNDPNGDKAVLNRTDDENWSICHCPDGSLVIVSNHIPRMSFRPDYGSWIDHWSDGMNLSDWTPNGGSPTFNAAKKNPGLVDLGGRIYSIDVDGGRHEMFEEDGSYWVNDNYIDSDGNVVVHSSLVFGDAGLQGVTPGQFAEFVNFFFKKEFNEVRAPVNWRLYKNLGKDVGLTSKEKDGTILIQISYKAMLDMKLLYHTVGHELVHAADLTNGNYEKWVKAVTTDGWVGADRDFLIRTIFEHHAYMWDAATEIKFGTDYGAQKMLEFTTFTLEPWGYLSLFDK